MYRTSEYVSTGHPDKVCDMIACFILDRFLEKDPMTRYALEVMIKDNHVTLGGEIT
ncbi:MAG: methionine adenosyltransferase, partial [Bacteroidales bacterium]|nr:methionine adenosyltransferase [Bacteroidales bacterium]